VHRNERSQREKGRKYRRADGTSCRLRFEGSKEGELQQRTFLLRAVEQNSQCARYQLRRRAFQIQSVMWTNLLCAWKGKTSVEGFSLPSTKTATGDRGFSGAERKSTEEGRDIRCVKNTSGVVTKRENSGRTCNASWQGEQKRKRRSSATKG